MSYRLINGKRYYKDDLTGRITLDNVSQAEADSRARRNQRVVRTTGTNCPQKVAGNGPTTGGTDKVLRAAGTVGMTASAGFPWKAAIACAVIALYVGAFFYNHFHVSSEEQAIADYMNAQQEQTAADTTETETASPDEIEAETVSPDEVQDDL